ncbi:uncharacterized protein [Maniola hyperantus]
MDEGTEVTLLDDDEGNSNPQTDQNSTDAAVPYDDNFEAASLELTTELPQNETAQDRADKEDEDEMAEITKTTKKPKGTGLDKFKRRLVRAIAHLLRNDQIPTDEIWEDLTKQSGCDCKLLWDRMRTLTMKKLRRLFTCEDKIANITPVAQFTVTDWLLFDLVLVHEKIDVIGQELQDPEAEESPKILEDLFATVVVFDLERLRGDKLTKAWFEATKSYNGTERQCSPMLLQRRWYQLKEMVREKFYQFWFMYRGSQQNLPAANEFKPTSLEMEIVKTFKYITTKPFPTWEESIQQKKVALPEDFERLQLAKRRIFRTETGPDLEVIEPQVETIDLDQEIESEDSRDSTSTRTLKENVNLGVVKIEKVDEISDDDDDVCVLDSVHISLEPNTNAETESSLRNSNEQNVEEQRSADVNIEEDISDVNDNHSSNDSIQFNSVTNDNLNLNTQIVDTTHDTGGIDSQDDAEMLLPTIVASTSMANISNEFDIIMPKISNVSSVAILIDEPVDNAVNSEINGILESVADNISTKNMFNVPQRTTFPTLDNIQNPDALVKNIDEEISSNEKVIEIKDEVEKGLDSFIAVPNHINIFDGIELEDDGIEYVEEEDLMKEVKPKEEIKTEKTDDSDSEYASTPTIDLKLLLTPVVYTKKLDDMDVFRFIDYNTVEDKRVIDNADNESKPYDRNCVKMEEISQERPPTPDSDAFSDSASEYHSEFDLGPENISPSSWLLNKLPKLSYNPIQLCKNPDFNTRLKRLSAGFFSSERNRRQLKECKPLTIDLHKSFETKLVNNTLYLTGTKSIENKTHGLEEHTIETTVFPTTLPLQNLVDNVINDILGPSVKNEDRGESQDPQKFEVPQDDDILGPAPPPDPSLAKLSALDSHSGERNKVINLPDIAQIRRLNEKLLTAEVSPIQISNITKAPVNIVSVQQRSDIASQNNKKLQNHNNIINKSIDSTASSTVSDINCETSSILDKISFTSDATCHDDHLIDTTHKTISLESNDNLNILSKGSSLKRFNNQLHKVVKEPKKQVRGNRVEVSWNPTPKKSIIPQDRLLTSDTVDKILNVCKGDDSWLKKTKAYKKAMRKRALNETKQKEKSSVLYKEINQCDNEGEVNMNEASAVTIDNEVLFISATVAPTENVCKNTGLNTVPNQTTNEINKKNPGNTMKRVERENLDKKRFKYCCWAREKMQKLGSRKKLIQKHKCPRPLCNCCCRQELVEKMFIVNKKRRDMLNFQTIQAETDKTTKLIKVNVSSQQRQNLTQMPQSPKENSTGKPLKVSIGINTDFDAEFETGFAANLAEFNTSSKFFDNESPAVSAIKVTYGPDDTQAIGQTQTSVNLMVLDKNNKTQILPGNNPQNVSDENAPTFSFSERNSFKEIPKTNRIVLDKRNPTFSIKENIMNKYNEIMKDVNPVKIRMVSDINDSAVTLQKTNPLKLKPIVLNKKNVIIPPESNLSAVITNKKSPISSIREWSDTRTKDIAKQSQLSSLLLDKYYPKIAPKTRIPQTPNLAPLSGGDTKVVLDEKGKTLDKILFLSNDRWNNAYSRTPICLGKNKILLCSFENTQLKNQPKLDGNLVANLSQSVNQSPTCQSTPPVVALPDGVRIVLLPNKELALSIDPGIELDSSQLDYLPTLMASIQKQLTAADEVDNITASPMDELKNKTDSNAQSNITLENRNVSDMKSDDKGVEKESLIEVTSFSCNENFIDHSNVMKVDINKTKERACHNKEENSTEFDKSNASVVDLKDDSDLNKKTILSDLMEMSGISAEDTHLTNHESPTKQQQELCPPPIIQGLQSQITNQHNEKFINNPLFNNPVVKAALNRCPELCIVFSYTELRYASENNARFFKMDIVSGVVMPINLVIKKQTQGEKLNKQITISKSVIDLTDDPEEGETISIEEQNAKTVELEPSAENVKDRAVPVKLFSVRPTILQRGRSLLVSSVKTDATSNVKKKKMIRIIKVKRKRKEPMECIDLDSDSEQKESPPAVSNSEAIPEKTKSDDDSDSDDEPLAFKAKRMKVSTECIEPGEELNQNTDDQEENLKDNNQSTETLSGEFTEIVNENLVDDTPSNITKEAHEDQTPQLEPVVFEPVDFGDDMPESSDEDCILGV